MLVADGVYDAFVAAIADQAKATKTSYGIGRHHEDAFVPPVNNAGQLQKVLGFIERIPAHAEVVAGGRHQGGDGFHVEPTVVAGLQQDDEMIQQEVFGPCITVQRFRDRGAGGRHGQRRRVRAGLQRLDDEYRTGAAGERRARLRMRVDQHPHPAGGRDAHGGFKHSGYGKDLSMYGFEDYTRIKHVMASLEG